MAPALAQWPQRGEDRPVQVLWKARYRTPREQGGWTHDPDPGWRVGGSRKSSPEEVTTKLRQHRLARLGLAKRGRSSRQRKIQA